MAAAAGQVRKVFGRPTRLQVTVLVGETNDGSPCFRHRPTADSGPEDKS